MEDIQIALAALGQKLGDKEAEAILNNLDKHAIRKAALRGNDMDEQTEAAHEEIRRQFKEYHQ
jgi:hypothetical protein